MDAQNKFLNSEGLQHYDEKLKEYIENNIVVKKGDGVNSIQSLSSSAKGDYSAAFGLNSTADGAGGFAMGDNAQAQGALSIALGKDTVAGTDLSIAGGQDSTASGFGSISIGYETNASKDYSIALGKNTVASNKYSFAIGGPLQISTDEEGNAVYQQTIASGLGSQAIGGGVVASGEGALATGIYTNASALASSSFGYGTKATGVAQTVIGKFNQENEEALFIVGNGTFTNDKRNALEVLKTGDVTINGNLTVNGKSTTVETFNENVNVEDNTITLRHNATTGLQNDQYTGIVAHNYDGANNGMLVFDNSGTAYVGDEGNLQPLATRDLTSEDNGSLIAWNEEKQTLVSSNVKSDAEDHSIVINEGEATGKYSIAGGSTDKSVISGLLGSLASTQVSIEAPKALASNSISLGSGTVVNSVGGNAIGVWNTVGCKGYYWKQLTNTAGAETSTFALSATRPSLLSWEPVSSVDWQIGDTICVIDKGHFPFCATITAIGTTQIGTLSKKTTVTITTTKLPFDGEESITLITPQNKSICAFYQKTEISAADNKRWLPRNGAVELGWAATAFGVENLNTGLASFATGWNNWQTSSFGFVGGRENISGYCDLTGGCYNINSGENNLVVGKYNVVLGDTAENIVGGRENRSSTARTSVIVGRQNEVNSSHSLVGGYSNTLQGEAAIVAGASNSCLANNCLIAGRENYSTCREGIVSGLSNQVLNGASSVVVGESNTVNASYHSLVAGRANNITGGSHHLCGGKLNTISGNSTIVGGENNQAAHNDTLVTGIGNKTEADYQTVVGKYANTKTDQLFTVGKGSSDSARSNAFEVLSDNNGNCSIKIGNTELTEAQLQKLIAFIDSVELS